MKSMKIITVSLLLLGMPALLLAGNWGSKTKMSMDIGDTAVSAKSFNTLVAALKAADLVDVLRGDGPFTVFPPTDAAFAKLPSGTVEKKTRAFRDLPGFPHPYPVKRAN